MEAYQGFAEVYDEFMDNVPYSRWAERLDGLIRKYGISRPEREVEGPLDSERNLLLDLGCGTGTLAELMYGRGYDVMGVDASEAMLNIAMEKKTKAVRKSSICSRICGNWSCTARWGQCSASVIP